MHKIRKCTASYSFQAGLLLYISCTAFIDYNARTVFGSPWEMFLEATYLIVSKGGSVSGYSGFFTYIPELQLSLCMVMCKCARVY